MARRVNWTDAAVLFVATLAASTAFADEDGFVDDWHGNMTILTKSSLGSSFEDIPSLVTNIRTTFDTAAKNINVCEQLKYAVMKGRRGVTWRGCKAPDNVDRELRVKPGLNLIKLKYIFPQAHIIFDTLSIGFPPSYTVDATFDIFVELTIMTMIDIDGETNAQDPKFRNSPLAMSTLTVRIKNAKASIPVGLVNVDIQQIKDQLESQILELSNPVDIGDLNASLHSKAGMIAQALAAQIPGTNAYFSFAIFIADRQGNERDDKNRRLVLQFSKDVLPPRAPVGCSHSVGCGDSVAFNCTDSSPEIFLLQRFLGSTPRWWTVSMASRIPSFGLSAFLSETNGTGAPSDEYRVCLSNKWGVNCGDKVTVALPHDRCAGPGPSTSVPCGAAGKPRCPTTHVDLPL